MKIMGIENIHPYEKNAKKHSKKQVEQVAASIKEFGFNQPIVVDKNGVIIVGHGRFEAAKLLGLAEVPTITVDLTDEQAKAYRLADNKLNESDWDMELAVNELKELSDDMQKLTGFELDLLIEPDEKDDVVPETPEEPKSKLGDLYELGEHRVLCGDSTKIEDVEKLMDGKKADMVFTDPPYELDTKGGGILKEANSMKQIRDNKVDTFEPDKLLEYSKTDVYCCNKPLVKNYIELAEKQNRPFDINFYKKENVAPNYGGHLMTDVEYIMVIGSQSPKKGFPKETYSKAFIGKKDKGNKLSYSKPVALCEKYIKLYSYDIILDLFGGSGSTLIAAEKLNRKCYMMELYPKYVDVIVQRYVDYTGNETIKKNGEEIIWNKSQK